MPSPLKPLPIVLLLACAGTLNGQQDASPDAQRSRVSTVMTTAVGSALGTLVGAAIGSVAGARDSTHVVEVSLYCIEGRGMFYGCEEYGQERTTGSTLISDPTSTAVGAVVGGLAGGLLGFLIGHEINKEHPAEVRAGALTIDFSSIQRGAIRANVFIALRTGFRHPSTRGIVEAHREGDQLCWQAPSSGR